MTNRLARMLGGPDLPDDEDENSSRPRNTQFELFVGAWLASGGVWVRHGEPDLVVRLLDEELGVAAKRIRSRGKIIRRVKEAADQIEARTRVGIVALNVDHLLDELTNSRDPELLGRQFDEAFPEFEDGLVLLAERPAIKGLLALGLRLGWTQDADAPQLEMGLFIKWRALIRSDAEGEAMNAFWERFSRVQADRLTRF